MTADRTVPLPETLLGPGESAAGAFDTEVYRLLSAFGYPADLAQTFSRAGMPSDYRGALGSIATAAYERCIAARAAIEASADADAMNAYRAHAALARYCDAVIVFATYESPMFDWTLAVAATALREIATEDRA